MPSIHEDFSLKPSIGHLKTGGGRPETGGGRLENEGGGKVMDRKSAIPGSTLISNLPADILPVGR